MKIGWATPLHHASAIGRVGVGVTNSLARRGHSIDLLRSERAELLGEACLATELPIVNLAGMGTYRALRDYDLLVYNIGDNAGYHQHAVEAAMAVPGICIFHDLMIFSLFEQWLSQRGERAQIAIIVDALYGAGSYEPPKAGKFDLARVVARYPMLEWLAPYALGSVAHGRHYLDRLTQSCGGPVRHIPLAYDLPHAVPPPRIRHRSEPLRLTTIGHINGNKLAADIIRALGQSPRLRKHCTYRLAGPISKTMQARLGDLARRLGVALEITGAIPNLALAEEIGRADAMVCLRRPVLEGASASAIEAMLSGRPTLVLDHGFYRDLPDDLTLKLQPDFDMAALQDKIAWLLDNAEASRALGQRAAAWARETFSFDRYADAFLQLAPKAIESEPLMHLGTQLGQELAALGVHADDPAAARIAQTAMSLFCQGGELCPQI